MTIGELKQSGSIIFECISGSKAFGLATETSDTDIRGVFVLPREQFYSLNYVEQVNDESNNVVYFELRKLFDLLARNNPNMLELLAMPADCILHKHPLYDKIRPEIFLSKLCNDSFAGYAMTQIKKAKGLKKKIVNPVDKERKSVLDFCYVVQGQGSIPLKQFLKEQNIVQEHCGLVAIPHMHDTYGLYHNPNGNYRGIMRTEDSNAVAVSQVGKEEEPVGVMSFNKDGYSTYCKDYKEYWEWVENRNEERYKTTLSHGKNYDSKNMMHTFRLLDMAEEIGKTGQLIVRRPNREFLLQIKRGEFEYNDLVATAEKRVEAISGIYAQSALPERPDLQRVNELLTEIRSDYYKG